MGAILAFAVLGVLCALLANLPALLQGRAGGGVSASNRRLVTLLVAQSVLFAGYALLFAYLHRQSHITTLAQATLLGGVFGLIPVLAGSLRSRAQLISSVAVGLAILVCSATAFLLTPMTRGS